MTCTMHLETIETPLNSFNPKTASILPTTCPSIIRSFHSYNFVFLLLFRKNSGSYGPYDLLGRCFRAICLQGFL